MQIFGCHQMRQILVLFEQWTKSVQKLLYLQTYNFFLWKIRLLAIIWCFYFLNFLSINKENINNKNVTAVKFNVTVSVFTDVKCQHPTWYCVNYLCYCGNHTSCYMMLLPVTQHMTSFQTRGNGCFLHVDKKCAKTTKYFKLKFL